MDAEDTLAFGQLPDAVCCNGRWLRIPLLNQALTRAYNNWVCGYIEPSARSPQMGHRDLTPSDPGGSRA